MDAKFINHTVMDKKTCKDFFALTWPKNAGKMRYVLVGFGALSVLYGFVQVILFGLGGVGSLISFSILGGVGLYLGQWGYKLKLGEYVKKQQMAWGAPTFEKDVTFYEDGLKQEYPQGVVEFKYSQLTHMLHNKNSIVFCFGKDALLVKKDSFTKGTAEECLAFVEKKMKQAKENKEPDEETK